jgi:nucleoid-associated protein YgaU
MSRTRPGRWFWVGVALILVGPGCARKPPDDLSRAHGALEAARSACARDYAPAELDSAEERVDELDRLAETRKYRQIKKAAPEAIEEAGRAEAAAGDGMARARSQAETALREAQEAVLEAQAAGAGEHAERELASARSSLEGARRLSAASDCRYPEVGQLAGNAMKDAVAARSMAVAEKRRLDEEAVRWGAEKRLRRLREEEEQEEEERRRALEAAAKPTSFTVPQGYNLWRLAAMDQIYGDPFQWPLIYRANRSQIKDPDLIYPQQVLKIPRDVPRQEVEQAIQAAKNREWPAPEFLQDGN